MRSSSGIERRPALPGGVMAKHALRLLAVLALAGCDDIAPVATFEPITDPAQLFMALTLNHRAVNLSTAAPYDTLRLTATPRNGLGEPMSGLPAPTFRSSDTTRVWVSPDGLLRARRAASRIKIVAELVGADNIRHVDTAYVNVTTNPAPPELVTFSITPESPADAVWAMNPGVVAIGATILQLAGIDVIPELPLRALDGNGDPIPGLTVAYRSLDPDIVRIDGRTGTVSATAPGVARIVAASFAYGVSKADTAAFTVTLPVVNVMGVEERPDSSVALMATEVTVRTNGYVFWLNQTTKPLDITFDDPADVADIPEVCAALGEALCGGGDIPGFAYDPDAGPLSAIRGRRFPVPGVYSFHSALIGLSGRVIVTDDTTN